jgi:methionine-S-sulfoxide reductase/methionine-R-sulfoxide reductase
MRKLFFGWMLILGISSISASPRLDTATFAMGCFWCTQAQFQLLKGVKSVVAGYTGGHVAKPSYKMVCTGNTGHAEACNIVFDPAVISYDELLAAFFRAHDPTQLNRQGNDVGTQYRSAIFYHNPTQKRKAEYYISKLNEAKAYKNPIVTEVAPYTMFYMAEADEQDFYNKNPSQRYCRFVIQPEVEKFKQVFKYRLKPVNPYYSTTDTTRLSVTNAEWKKILPPELYAVSRERATEKPFTGKYLNNETKGTYFCAVCGNKLFRSDAKFSSTCGWPSFYQPTRKNSVIYREDNSSNMHRTEVICSRCGSHLGHIFDDGPPPTHKRFCMNSVSLDFIPDSPAR